MPPDARIRDLDARAYAGVAAAEDGQGLVEYGLIIALISILLMGALSGVKDEIVNLFTAISAAL